MSQQRPPWVIWSIILISRAAWSTVPQHQRRDSGVHFYHIGGNGTPATVIIGTVGGFEENVEPVDSAFEPHDYQKRRHHEESPEFLGSMF